MIEYVKKGKGNITLPKNIRQVNDLDVDKRVYIEDYAFSFIKDLVPYEDEEGRVGILLGEEKQEGDDTYVFVKGAMEVVNASVYEGRVTFTEETWTALNAAKTAYFQGMELVGWFLVSSSIKPDRNVSLERTHVDSFGKYKLLMYVNPSEQTEDVYTCFDGGLEVLDGYAVYFEKNEEMQTYMAATRSERRTTPADDAAAKRYRQLMKESAGEPKAKQQLSIMYVLSAVLVIMVLVIGVGRLQAERNLDGEPIQSEINGNMIESTAAVNASVQAVPDETLNVDYAEGNVTTTQAESESVNTDVPTETISEGETSGEEATEETTETTAETVEETTEAVTEAATEEVTHRVYVVQQGDTLYDIMNREYGGIDRLQELFELNGITDGGNSLNVGDELLMP